jgi:hypothetical protein
MTVAAVQGLDDETAAALTALMVGAAAALTAIAVKPKPLASSPQLATTTPNRVLMTFIAQPFRLIRAHEPGARACPTWLPIMAA